MGYFGADGKEEVYRSVFFFFGIRVVRASAAAKIGNLLVCSGLYVVKT